VRHPLRPYFRRHFRAQLRRQCAGAAVACYVTERTLQRDYPSGAGTLAFGASDVDLPPEAFVGCVPAARSGPLRAVAVGSLAQMYKGIDVALRALAEARTAGTAVDLTVVGDGCFRPALEAQARSLGLGGTVRFLGALPAGARVREEFDRADVFLMPSRIEGLPRALVEAMARGLPCLASAVGGIPELLPPEVLHPAGDHHALAAGLRALADDPARRARLGAVNLARASDFARERLDGVRSRFLDAVRTRCTLR
jgi:glycosyltransferase involved in cell wall biosynthesis